MTTQLDPIFAGDSQLFKVSVYAEDGVTPATPLSATCRAWNADTDAEVLAEAAGQVGVGYAQYNWAGTATAGNYEAVLTVTISAGVIKTEHFRVSVRAKPPEFTADSATPIGQVRAWLGDDVEGQGVRPDGSNLPDAVITLLLTAEGAAVMRAVAAACELLALQWARAADVTIGPRKESLSQVSKRYAERAAALRAQHGGAAAGFAIGMQRDDGYAENWTGSEDFGEALSEYYRARRNVRAV